MGCGKSKPDESRGMDDYNKTAHNEQSGEGQTFGLTESHMSFAASETELAREETMHHEISWHRTVNEDNEQKGQTDLNDLNDKNDGS